MGGTMGTNRCEGRVSVPSKRGWWHAEEKVCEWHRAGHGVGITLKGHG